MEINIANPRVKKVRGILQRLIVTMAVTMILGIVILVLAVYKVSTATPSATSGKVANGFAACPKQIDKIDFEGRVLKTEYIGDYLANVEIYNYRDSTYNVLTVNLCTKKVINNFSMNKLKTGDDDGEFHRGGFHRGSKPWGEYKKGEYKDYKGKERKFGKESKD